MLPSAAASFGLFLIASVAYSCLQDAAVNLHANGQLPPALQPAVGTRQDADGGGSPARRLASPSRRFFFSPVRGGMVSPMRGMVQFTGTYFSTPHMYHCQLLTVSNPVTAAPPYSEAACCPAKRTATHVQHL